MGEWDEYHAKLEAPPVKEAIFDTNRENGMCW
jgi:hypothetical protein